MGSFSPLPEFATFRYIELFAGIGGFRVALNRLGGHCVFSSEIDRFARRNYTLNHGDRPAGDITKISADSIPDHDMLVGGFPCQPFSFSGERKGFDDDRGVLFLEISRILTAKQPKLLLLENVRGLLTHDDGRTLATILTKLEECGYNIKYEVLDAVHIVPQERKRIYLAGIRKDIVADFVFPVIPTLSRGFKDIEQINLDTVELERLELSEHQLSKVRSQSYTERFPEARFLSDVTKPTKTIQSSYTKYLVGSQFVPVKGNVNQWRRLSPREAARLQGFPESFQLCQERPYHLLGNAVVPGLVALVSAPLLQLGGFSITKEKNGANHDVTHDKAGIETAKSLILDATPDDRRRCEVSSALNRI